MQDRKLEQALEIYFQENPDRESDKYQEIQKYLKLRIRSVMELLIENEDTERMEQIEKCGWFSANELENFIRCAQEKAKLRSLVWLLHLKDKKYGYGGGIGWDTFLGPITFMISNNIDNSSPLFELYLGHTF